MTFITPAQDNNRQKKLEAFDRLLTMMDELRLNCPWDKKQTHNTLRHLSIEEVYELSDAIIQGDSNEIRNELGDILLHIVFYSKIGSEKGDFDIADVINGVVDKMTERHPHIYGDVEVQNEEDVKRNWEAIKQKKEKKGVLSGVPQSMPALIKAIRIQDKARGAGFDWDRKEQVWAKVQEELQEFKEAPTEEEREKEFGDVLFSLVNYARFEKIDPEEALERTNKKFIKRFNYIEEQAALIGKSLKDMTLAEMDVYWEKAKLNE